MARLNVEEKWFSDPRRTALQAALRSTENLTESDLLSLAADGLALQTWRFAQDHYKNGRSLIPYSIFRHIPFAKALIDAGLAEINDVGDAVYVRGSEEFLGWLADERTHRKLAGRKGGQRSAQRPRDEQGRLRPRNDHT